jgi:hypothetical protein
MSFIDDIIGVGKSILGAGGGLGGNILKSVVTGYALNKLTKSINKDSEPAQSEDKGVTVSVSANAENKIPVLYGRAVTGGQLVDVRMSNSNNTIHYVYCLSEVTGTKLSNNLASVITFNNIYWSGYKINFQGDGITLASLEDLQGNLRTNWAGSVKVWCYNNGSNSGIVPQGYSGTVPPAWTVVPGWTASWQMSNLVFVVIQVDYVRKYNLVGIGDMTFDIQNTMQLPGDVLYDISTNTRYGAAIPDGSINKY